MKSRLTIAFSAIDGIPKVTRNAALTVHALGQIATRLVALV